MQLERLLLLLPWLVQNPGVSAQDAASEFGVTREQIERDLNLLIVCGLPGGQHGDLIDIQFWADDDDAEPGARVRADGSIHVLDPQTLARPMALGTDEAVSLLIGLSLLKELPGGIDRDLIDQVVAKLQDVAGDTAASVSTIQIAAPSREQSEHVQQVLDDALMRGRRVRMTYLVPTRDEVTERTVEPQQVVLTHGHVYLRAWCLLAGGERTFRVDRILDADVLDDPVDPEHTGEHHPPGEALTSGRVFSGGDDLLLVTIDVTAAGRWIAEYAPVESVSDLEAGGLRIDVRVADDRWIERLVLQAGGAATVVAPREISERLATRTGEALEAYR